MSRLTQRSAASTFLFFFFLIAASCTGAEVSAPATPTPLPTPIVPRKPVYEVVRGKVVETMQFTGRIVPVREQPLAFEREGRVADVYVDEGDEVEAGATVADLDVLAELVRRQEEQQLNVRRATLNKEIAALRLEAHNLTADPDAPDFAQQAGILERQVALADLALQEAQFALEDLEANSSAAQLISPMAGVVRSLSLRVGDVVVADEPVVVVADMSELEVSAELGSNEMAGLEEGMPVELEPARGPGPATTGIIHRLPYEAGGGSTAVASADESVRIALQEPAAGLGLSPGDRVRGTVVLAESDDTLWLPPQAIRAFEGRHFVIVQEGEGQQRVDVTLGIQGDGRVEIRAGLVAGQQVVGP